MSEITEQPSEGPIIRRRRDTVHSARWVSLEYRGRGYRIEFSERRKDRESQIYYMEWSLDPHSDAKGMQAAEKLDVQNPRGYLKRVRDYSQGRSVSEIREVRAKI